MRGIETIKDLFKLTLKDLNLSKQPQMKTTLTFLWISVVLFSCLIWSYNYFDSKMIDRQTESFNRLQTVQIQVARQAMEDNLRSLLKELKAFFDHDVLIANCHDDHNLSERIKQLLRTTSVASITVMKKHSQGKIEAISHNMPSELGEEAAMALKEVLLQKSKEGKLSENRLSSQIPILIKGHPFLPLFMSYYMESDSTRYNMIVIIDMLHMLNRYISPLKGTKYSVSYLLDERGTNIYNRGGDMLSLNSKRHPLLKDLTEKSPSGSNLYIQPQSGFDVIVNWDTIRFLNRKFIIILAVPEKELIESIQRDRTIMLFLTFFVFSSIGMVILLLLNQRNKLALKKSERRYQTIIDEQFELVNRFTPDGLITFANDAYCIFFEMSRDDVIGARLDQIFGDEQSDRIKHSIESITVDKPSTMNEEKVIKSSGKVSYLSWTNRGIFDEYGNLEEIQGVARDITEKKVAESILEEETRQMERLHHIVQVLASIRDEEELFQRLLKSLTEDMDYFCASIITFVGEKNRIFSATGSRLLPDIETMEKARKKGLAVTKQRRDGLYQTSIEVNFQGKELGMLNVIKETKPNDSNLRILSILADHFSGLWEITRLMNQITQESLVDALTGIWNRRYILKYLGNEQKRLSRYGGRASLVLADIGDFKRINDVYGHLKGDEALQKVASILDSSTRSCDVVARYGGDEFLLYLPDTSPSEAKYIMSRVAEEVSQNDFPSIIYIDYGIAGYPDEGKDIMEIIKKADDRMYRSKAKRKETSKS